MKITAVVKINKVLLYIKQETKNHWNLVSVWAAMQRKARMDFCFVCLIIKLEIILFRTTRFGWIALDQSEGIIKWLNLKLLLLNVPFNFQQKDKQELENDRMERNTKF